MNLRSFINFGESLRTAAGINICMDDNQLISISYCVLKRDNELVTLVKKESNNKDLDSLILSLKNILPAHSPVYLNIEGNGILIKQIDKILADESAHDRMKRNFPMVREGDFLDQSYSNNNKAYLSILRKTTLNHIENVKLNFSILSISLGPFVVSGISTLLKTRRINFNNYSVEINDNMISDISVEKNDEPESAFEIGGDKVLASELLAYSAAWNGLFPDNSLVPVNIEWVSDERLRFDLNATLFKSSKKSLLVVLLILLVNSFSFFWLTARTQELEATDARETRQSEKSFLREKEYSTITNIFSKIGWNSNIVPVYYADQIAVEMVPQIRLISMEIGVVNENTLRKEKKYEYQANLIRLKGSTDSPEALLSWVNRLEKLYFVEKVFDQRYNHDAKLNRGVFEFLIQLK